LLNAGEIVAFLVLFDQIYLVSGFYIAMGTLHDA